MAPSRKQFERWVPHEDSSWSMQVLQRYDAELMGLWGTQISSSAFTYAQLGASGAQWTDQPGAHFSAGVHVASYFSDLKEWSEAFNRFGNWVRLSVILTLASNLETYVASVVKLAIESDPGLLIGASRSVDGAEVAKQGRAWVVDVREHIEACTKGDWSSRLGALTRLFGTLPQGLRDGHADLEELRGVRNRFGHAFGRDIELARRTATKTLVPMESVSRERVQRLRDRALRGARALDGFLLARHVGEFEAVQFYANLFPTLHPHVSRGQRAAYLKKAIGGHGAQPRGKRYCNQLVDYWEEL